MPTRPLFTRIFGGFCLSLLLISASDAATFTLKAIEGLPEGVSSEVAGVLNPQGYEIAGEKGAVAKIWLTQSSPIKADFKPTLSVKYPFESGEFLGAMEVVKGTKFTDFRGQTVKPGVYTLRYGKQPVDGNHVGTSELADFILALPASQDADPKPIEKPKDLAKKSAKSVSSNHPAIFSLQPAEEAPEEAELVHEEKDEFWILNVAATGTVDNEKQAVPLRLVVIGHAKE
ncbi:MAG: hypothetical protein WEB58_19705 [Planctomycetaceae bacterium]